MATKAGVTKRPKATGTVEEKKMRRGAKAPAGARPNREAVESEVLATAHALGAALHRVGVVDAATMRDLDALCMPPRLTYGSAVRRARPARLRAC